MTDPVITVALLSAFVACVGAANWAGWLGGARSERALSLQQWQDMLASAPGDLIRQDDALASVVVKWWSDGYDRGYRDGKNNKRRQDRESARVSAPKRAGRDLI